MQMGLFIVISMVSSFLEIPKRLLAYILEHSIVYCGSTFKLQSFDRMTRKKEEEKKEVRKEEQKKEVEKEEKKSVDFVQMDLWYRIAL